MVTQCCFSIPLKTSENLGAWKSNTGLYWVKLNRSQNTCYCYIPTATSTSVILTCSAKTFKTIQKAEKPK